MGTRNPEQYGEMLRRLREARKEAGIRQTDVAEALGVNQTFVSKVELGERRIDPTSLTIDDLATGNIDKLQVVALGYRKAFAGGC